MNTAWHTRMQRAACVCLFVVFVYQAGMTAGVMRLVAYVSESASAILDIGGWFASQGIRHSVIFLGLPQERNREIDPTNLFLMVRNEPDFSNTNLTALDLGSENMRVMKFYSDRRYLLYVADVDARILGEKRQWSEIHPLRDD